MSVIGIDLGSANCVIAHASRKGVVTVLNEASSRKSSNLISFRDGQRHLASDADSVARGNYKNSVWYCNRLVGLRPDSEAFQEEVKSHPYAPVFSKDSRGKLVAKLQYGSEKKEYEAVQLVAMLLGKLQQVALREVKGVPDIVITVPSWFDDRQRREVLAACDIANVRCIQLINDNVAVALQFGIWKNKGGVFDDEKKHHALFLDMGASQFTCTAAVYQKGKLHILASSSDRSLGGRLIDMEIAKYLAAEFKAKTGNDVMSNPKALIKLLQAARKAKHNVCGGVPSASISVECLLNDSDLNSKLSRETLAEIVSPLLERFVAPIKRVLSETGMEGKDFDMGIECVGGSMRTPAFVREAAKILGTDLEARNFGLSRTLDMDEAAAHGACLQCAMKSPNIRLQTEFDVSDAVPIPVELVWDAADEVRSSAGMDVDEGDEAASSSFSPLVTFERNSKCGLRKIPLKRAKDFQLKLQYKLLQQNQICTESPELATATVSGMPDGNEPLRCKCVCKVDESGLYTFFNAYYVKKVKVEEAKKDEENRTPSATTEKPAEKVDGEGDTPMADASADSGSKTEDASKKDEENNDQKMSDGDSAAPAAPSTGAGEVGAEVKYKNKRFQLTLTTVHSNALSSTEVMELQEKEAKMAQADRIIRETEEARNDIETFIYDFRSRIGEYGELKDYCNGEENSNFNSKLQDAEDWLYSDDGFDAKKSTLVEKLTALKDISSVFLSRQTEDKERPALCESLKKMVAEYVKRSGDEQHAHLTDEDRDQVKAHCNAAEGWLKEQLDAQAKLPSSVDPVLLCKDIRAKASELSKQCDPIVNKPKPKPPKEDKKEETEEKKEGDAGSAGQKEASSTNEAEGSKDSDTAAPEQEPMQTDTNDEAADAGMSKSE